MTSDPTNERCQLRLTATAAATIREEALNSRDGTETGGILLGSADHPHFLVRQAGRAGPAAVRLPAFFLRDLAHAQRLAAEAWDTDGSVWIGDWHTHPRTPPTPSERDLHTYAQLLADPELAFTAFAALIISPARPDWLHLKARAWIYRTGHVASVTIVVDPSNVDAPPTTTGPRPPNRSWGPAPPADGPAPREGP
jgi:integrative and conjugative element protein (TIGR02256 family)